jgi:hypothetical protein
MCPGGGVSISCITGDNRRVILVQYHVIRHEENRSTRL